MAVSTAALLIGSLCDWFIVQNRNIEMIRRLNSQNMLNKWYIEEVICQSNSMSSNSKYNISEKTEFLLENKY